MADQEIRVLHLDTERSWRGGQQQAVYLHTHLLQLGITSVFITRKSSALAEYCTRNDLVCYSIPVHFELDPAAACRISRIVRKERINILHAHTAHALTLGIMVKILNPGLILIAVRRVEFSILHSLGSRWKYTNNLVDKIVCISHKIRQVLLAEGLASDKLITIHSGIDLTRFLDYDQQFDIHAKYGIPASHLLVGTIAAFVGEKDYPSLLKAASLIISAKPDVTFIALGDGTLALKLKQLHSELNLGSRFIFCGFQSRVGDFLHDFDIYVMASRKEGLGTSILDALSVGLPVVATRSGGIPEVIIDGYNGLLVEKEDPAALAAALSKLITDFDLRKKLAKNALVSVRDFAITNTVRRNVNLYRELLNYAD